MRESCFDKLWVCVVRAVMVFACVVAVGFASAGTLPIRKVVGFTSNSAPLPFQNSARAVVESPPGIFGVYTGGELIGPRIETGFRARLAAVAFDDETLYVLNESAFERIRLSDGMVLGSIANRNGNWQNFTESPSGDLVALGGVHGVALLRVSDFTVLHTHTITPTGESFVFDEANGFLYGIGPNQIFQMNIFTGVTTNLDFDPEEVSIEALAVREGRLLVLSGGRYQSSHGSPIPIVSTTDIFTIQYADTGEIFWQDIQGGTSFDGSVTPSAALEFSGILANDGSVICIYEGAAFLIAQLPNNGGVYFEGVTDAVLSHDNARVGMNRAGNGGELRVYEFGAPPSDFIYKAQQYRVVPKALNGPDGSVAANTTIDGMPSIYRASDETSPSLTLICPEEQNGCFNTVFKHWIPGTNYLLADDYSLKVWNTATGVLERTLFNSEQSSNVRLMPPSRDGSKVLLLLYNPVQGCTAPICPTVRRSIELRDTSLLLGGAGTGAVSILPPPGYFSFATAILSPDNTRIYAVAVTSAWGVDDLVVSYDATTGNMVSASGLERLNEFDPAMNSSLEFLESGELLVSTTGNELNPVRMSGFIRVYSTPTLQLLDTLSSGKPTSHILGENGSVIAARQGDVVNLIDTAIGDAVISIPVDNTDTLHSFAYADGGDTLVVPNSGMIFFYDLDVPALQILPTRDRFLDPSLGSEGTDYNGDGIFDAADFVAAW